MAPAADGRAACAAAGRQMIAGANASTKNLLANLEIRSCEDNRSIGLAVFGGPGISFDMSGTDGPIFAVTHRTALTVRCGYL